MVRMAAFFRSSYRQHGRSSATTNRTTFWVLGAPRCQTVRWISKDAFIVNSRSPRPVPSGSLLDCLCSDGLHVEGDLDVVADDDAAALEQLVPVEPELLAVDRGLGEEADPLVPPGVLARAEVFGIELHRTRHPAHRELAEHPVSVLPPALDLAALEGDRRVVLDVEEFGGAVVLVPVGLVGVDARGLGPQRDVRG